MKNLWRGVRTLGVAVAFLLVLRSVPALAAEISVSRLPLDPFAVAATEKGELWLANHDQLWRVTSEGSAEVVPTPMRVDRMSWGGPSVGLWIASPTGAALLDPSGEWHVISTEASLAVYGIVSLGGTRAALVRRSARDRPAGPGQTSVDTEVLFLDATSERVSRTDVFEGCALNPVEADGAGGFWAELELLRKDDSNRPVRVHSGYLHSSNGAWTAWTSGGDWPREWTTPSGLVTLGMSPAWFPREDTGGSLFAGAGGAGFFAVGKTIYRVGPDGTSELFAQEPLGASEDLPTTPQAITYDPADGGHLLLLTSGTTDRGVRRDGSPTSLVLMRWGHDGIHREPVPVPSWVEQRPSVLVDGMVATAGGVTWVVLSGVLFKYERETWTVFSSDEVRRSSDEGRPFVTEDLPRPRVEATTVASAFVGASLSLGLGTFGGSGLRGERWFATGAESLAGALLATAPGLMALELSPFSHSWSIDGPGAALGVLGTLGGLTLEIGASTVGTWATGELAFGPSRSPWGALGGAFVGSLVGAVLGLAVDALLAKVFPHNEALRWSFSIGLVGAGTTLGYQWLGGGPRRAP